jgi:zinc transporter ZupT
MVPLTLATAIACAAFAAMHGQTVFETLLTILTFAVALQGGYMVGLTSREFLVPSKRI